MNAVGGLWRAARRRGWIGVDLGSQCTKLAQVARTNGHWRLTNRWIIGERGICEGVPTEAETRNAALKACSRLFRGRAAAAAVPMSQTTLRLFELPTAPWADVLAMVEQELAAELQANSGGAFDAWLAEAGTESNKVMAVSSDQELCQRIAEDLLAAGMHCQVLDVVPCALARAVSMCVSEDGHEPVAALDLGETTACLTIVKAGRPVFCRLLRDCGLRSLTQPLRDELSLPDSECRLLISRLGLARNSGAEHTTAAMLARPFERLVDELRKTLQFIDHQAGHLAPTRVWLFGGGAMVGGIEGYLEERTGVAAARWTLGSHGGGDHSDPLYGVAVGLSLLAWESDRCM